MTQAVLKNEVTELEPEIGLRAEQRGALADMMSDALADAFRLYINLLGLHWNVEGPTFYSLHKLTEEQYESVNASIDDIAERIRALGLPAPHALRFIEERSLIDDLPDGTLKARIDHMVQSYEKASVRLKRIVREAEKADDVMTAGMLTDLVGNYEESAWMLRATAAQ